MREAVGLFDVSHMGEAYLRGPQRARGRRPADHERGRVGAGRQGGLHAAVPAERRHRRRLHLLQARRRRVLRDRQRVEHGQGPRRGSASTRRRACDVDDVSDETALIAVQGPKAVAMVDALAGGTLAQMPSFTFADADGRRRRVHRRAHRLHRRGRLRARVRERATRRSCGTRCSRPRRRSAGCRSASARATRCASSRKLPLYGNDLDDDHTPLEAGLGWAVKLDKAATSSARRAARAEGDAASTRQLVGFKIDEGARAIARHGYAVVDRAAAAQPIGIVTSGGPGIFVGGAIGLAYVPTALAAAGTQLTIDCRGKDVAATVVSGKFYKRAEVSTHEHASPPISVTPTITSGSARRARAGASASRSSPSISSATSRSSICRRKATSSPRASASARSRASRASAICTRRSPARSSRSTPRSRTRPSTSTPSRTARAG